MSKVIKLKKGLDINLCGKAEPVVKGAVKSNLYAVKPTDFKALTPKLSVKVGDTVLAGDALFVDKLNPEVKFVSPVSGKVVEVARGERRKLLAVVVEADSKTEYKKFDVQGGTKEAIKATMLDAGVWPMVIQRPYGIIANANVEPKAIYVSAFDSAPLAPDYQVALKGKEADLNKGFEILSLLAGKPVNLGLKAGMESSIFASMKNVEINYFDGPHPAGNVGIQIAHTSPINKGEYVWTVNIQDVAIIGHLFNSGNYVAEKVVAVAGSGVATPAYYQVTAGVKMDALLASQSVADNYRVICGNVLTGTKVARECYMCYYTNVVTVIPEGDHYEFMGWMMPGTKKFSATRLFGSFLCPKKVYDLDTNYNGEGRAFVVSGQYENVLPMDIYPVYLLKAALAGDIDQMEQLGIYEVIPEDMALCEFVCTSKIPVQEILDNGIALMMKETN